MRPAINTDGASRVVSDTETMTLALPDARLVGTQELLKTLLGRQKCTQRELLSVVGRLVHASKCVPPGRAFTRLRLDAAHSVSGPNRRVRITADVRAVLRWWATFADVERHSPLPSRHRASTITVL